MDWYSPDELASELWQLIRYLLISPSLEPLRLSLSAEWLSDAFCRQSKSKSSSSAFAMDFPMTEFLGVLDEII
mgnify:FL=1